MNDAIEKLSLEIEKAIVQTNKIINKINLFASLKDIAQMFTIDKILTVSKKNFDKIVKNVKGPNQLLPNEEEFIKSIIRMPDEIKQMKSSLGWGKDQVKVIENIQQKIIRSSEEFSELDISQLEKSINDYKT